MNGEKERIRREYRAIRARIPQSLRDAKSEKIVKHLADSHLFLSHHRILCYAALPEEADLTSVRALCIEHGKQIAFPKVCGDEILFFEVRPQETLSEGTFHVPEPDTSDGRRPVFWEDALCLTPGVVFDRSGNRFGYGKGYYDRFFAAHPGIIRCGIAFTEQLVESPLPVEKTDLPMHFLITDGELKQIS